MFWKSVSEKVTITVISGAIFSVLVLSMTWIANWGLHGDLVRWLQGATLDDVRREIARNPGPQGPKGEPGPPGPRGEDGKTPEPTPSSIGKRIFIKDDVIVYVLASHIESKNFIRADLLIANSGGDVAVLNLQRFSRFDVFNGTSDYTTSTDGLANCPVDRVDVDACKREADGSWTKLGHGAVITFTANRYFKSEIIDQTADFRLALLFKSRDKTTVELIHFDDMNLD